MGIDRTELRRKANENERQYIWRLGSAKDAGLLDLNWEELTDIFNRELRKERSWYNESAYRKPYQMAKAYYDDVFSRMEGGADFADMLTQQQHRLERERMKLRDERRELARLLRDDARLEERISEMERAVQCAGRTSFPAVPAPAPAGNSCDLLVCLSDIHYGACYNSSFGAYSPEIAQARMAQYLAEITEIGKRHGARDCHVMLLGDMISGNIHKSLAVTNRENVVQQVMACAELVASFLYRLSRNFQMAALSSVGGNHTRLERKEDAQRDERLDDIIPWYCGSTLSHLENVKVLGKKIDPTICALTIRGKQYIGVHGDYDRMTEAGIARLVMLLGHKPYAVLRGHNHVNATDEIGGVRVVQSGCFGGSGDEYTVTRRLSGLPGQTVCVCGGSGIEALYPVTFK